MDSEVVPSSKYVTLISGDGFEFIVTREAAFVSATLRGMLSVASNFEEAQTNRVLLENINATCLEKICEYMYYNLTYKDSVDVPDFDVPPEMALELLVAADYLNT
ncbi:putative transcriptional elongation regulator Elc1/Elongin C [Nadsonia fulvescens var. elongata DSM 6958]|uniref:Elongin-C n=1 Tax=Nadsonia fulvescens var. elongata DSM 6958 TaxID=857566 RepID=A0A1E3PJP7_9ASCO|nr:putative transcriptional elongation regulator Elc1/Elongin C [Nadsonia fulvescens var. elongata DSM 6958]